MVRKYSYIKSEGFALICILPLLRHTSFSRGLFIIGAPCVGLNLLNIQQHIFRHILLVYSHLDRSYNLSHLI